MTKYSWLLIPLNKWTTNVATILSHPASHLHTSTHSLNCVLVVPLRPLDVKITEKTRCLLPSSHPTPACMAPSACLCMPLQHAWLHLHAFAPHSSMHGSIRMPLHPTPACMALSACLCTPPQHAWLHLHAFAPHPSMHGSIHMPLHPTTACMAPSACLCTPGMHGSIRMPLHPTAACMAPSACLCTPPQHAWLHRNAFASHPSMHGSFGMPLHPTPACMAPSECLCIPPQHACLLPHTSVSGGRSEGLVLWTWQVTNEWSGVPPPLPPL